MDLDRISTLLLHGVLTAEGVFVSGFRRGATEVVRVERGNPNRDELDALTKALLSVLTRNRDRAHARGSGPEGRPAAWGRWERAPYRAPRSWR
ncbi:acyl-CoA carboxylase subunit epsilon [Streptomyces sp. NPDC002466]|uniref:acyl-CoA carboxylase subunit epsilon n=1 Tax=unclassified Streptomyces TaxID=2593676 RepID=UPI0035DC4161